MQCFFLIIEILLKIMEFGKSKRGDRRFNSINTNKHWWRTFRETTYTACIQSFVDIEALLWIQNLERSTSGSKVSIFWIKLIIPHKSIRLTFKQNLTKIRQHNNSEIKGKRLLKKLSNFKLLLNEFLFVTLFC